VSYPPGILARGPWKTDQVASRWREEEYEPPPARTEAADEAIAALEDRGSPAHDGLAARLAGFEAVDGRLQLELQPMRWSLRLVREDASASLAALCVTRDADGRWLAGRRAKWVASWAGRWALGAGGAVDLGESPAGTLTRELREEWQLTAERVSIEALVALAGGMAMLVGMATVPDTATPVPDDEHDDWAWWPADVERWPDEADERLRTMATLLS
jgi:8-oxo-dGTP diphosphatase